MKPRLLDLFCGAGGCTKGYQRAGFYVVGVDINPQPRYCGDEFIQANALQFVTGNHIRGFDAVHASPPCQGYSACKSMHTCRGKTYPMLIEPTRKLLLKSGLPYILENVERAPLFNAFILCGTMFGLKLFRHRLFETNFDIGLIPGHNHAFKKVGHDGFVCMAGHGDSGRGRIAADHRNKKSWIKASGIGWMTRSELSQAIPPAYTEFIGKQLMKHLEAKP